MMSRRSITHLLPNRGPLHTPETHEVEQDSGRRDRPKGPLILGLEPARPHILVHVGVEGGGVRVDRVDGIVVEEVEG